MEEKKLNLDAPFLSVRQIPKSSTEHETPVLLLQDDQSFNHVMEPSLVPFLWEQTPGKPKYHHTLLEESADLIKALEMVSSTASFSVNCSTNGVSDEFEKNGDRSSNVSKDDVILEYRDLIMSRFLPAAKAIALRQKIEYSLEQEEKMMKKKKKQIIALQRVSMAINQDLNNDDYDHNHVYSSGSKKATFEFLPRFCSKNSLDVLNPVLSRVKTCQNLTVQPGKIINPKSQGSIYKTKPVSSSPRILSKSQELYPIPRNRSRLQRTSSNQIKRQDTRFLAEGVKRMRSMNKNRSESLSVSQPPLPKTPSESWLCRTLPRVSAATTVVPGQLSVVLSGQATGLRKMEQKTNIQSTKWETIVKTSYGHARYSKELITVHPGRQHEP